MDISAFTVFQHLMILISQNFKNILLQILTSNYIVSNIVTTNAVDSGWSSDQLMLLRLRNECSCESRCSNGSVYWLQSLPDQRGWYSFNSHKLVASNFTDIKPVYSVKTQYRDNEIKRVHTW